jgi:hypothetical protein
MAVAWLDLLELAIRDLTLSDIAHRSRSLLDGFAECGTSLLDFYRATGYAGQAAQIVRPAGLLSMV